MLLQRLRRGPLLGATLGVAMACGDAEVDGSGSAGSCVPGQAVACVCPGGGEGVQVCAPDGVSYGSCTCDDATGGHTEGSGGATGSTGATACGNGLEEPGECPSACPQDCSAADDTASSTTGDDGCGGGPIYATSVPMQPSRWASGALLGFAAGQDLCRQAAAAAGVPEPTEVTVCDYEQVLLAAAAGELAGLAGTSAWIHRTTVADVMGVPSAPGAGGRCAEWTYAGNELADGEHADIAAGGVVTYTLDDDTAYDGVDASHAQPAALECGTQLRAIPCCHPACAP